MTPAVGQYNSNDTHTRVCKHTLMTLPHFRHPVPLDCVGGVASLTAARSPRSSAEGENVPPSL